MGSGAGICLVSGHNGRVIAKHKKETLEYLYYFLLQADGFALDVNDGLFQEARRFLCGV